MAGDVEARIDAALHVQVLGDTAGDVGRPANVPVRVGEWCGEVDDVPRRRWWAARPAGSCRGLVVERAVAVEPVGLPVVASEVAAALLAAGVNDGGVAAAAGLDVAAHRARFAGVAE